MRRMKHSKIFAVAFALACALLIGVGSPSVEGHAASGTVYSCTINRGYRHPVTGVVEDAGGEGSYVTGQGMIEGCVYPSGLFEKTDSGECYLTIRMGLADFTSGHTFYVQNRGESGWTQVGVFASATGSDSNGTTLDVCIPVPQSDCIIRGSMYVEPMGRDVIFFINPSNFVEGNSVGMVQSYVTEETGAPAEPVEEPVAEEPAEEVVEEPEAEEAMPNVDDSTLDNAKGLSLSTEKDVKVSEKKEEKPKSDSSVVLVVLAVIAIAAVAGGGVWIAKKNKNKGDTRDDEE